MELSVFIAAVVALCAAAALAGSAAAVWTVAALCAAAFFAGPIFHRLRSAWCLRKVPSPPALTLVGGHLAAILSPQAPLIFAEWGEQYGPLVRLRFLADTVVLLSDPVEAGRVLRRSRGANALPKAREIYTALELGIEPPTPNILTADDGPLWKAVRAAVAPAFSATSLKQALPRVLEVSRKAAGLVAQAAAAGGPVDIGDIAKRVTSDVMGTLLFGEDLGGVDGRPSEYMDVFQELLEATHARFSNPLRQYAVWDPKVRREAAALRLHDRIMSAKVDALKRTPPPSWTIAAHLLKTIDPATGQPLTHTQLKAEVAVVFGAGFETTCHGISWVIAALAAHPAAQERVARELASVGLAPTRARPEPRDYEYQDGGRLPYLNAVIKEALRLFSPAALGTTRVTACALEIAGYALPARCAVMVPPGAMGLQGRAYDAPRAFRPERWLPSAGGGSAGSGGDADARANGDADAVRSRDQEQQQQPAPTQQQQLKKQQQQQGAGGGIGDDAAAAGWVPPVDSLPFMTGPRDCVGQALAMLELQAVVATLVGRFVFDLSGEAACGADLLTRATYHVTLASGWKPRARPRGPVDV